MQVTSFADLAPSSVTVEVTAPGGIMLRVPMRTLTYFEWNRIGYEVPSPTPPISGADKQGRPVFDNRNPDYLRAVDEASLERTYRRLLASLALEVPGATTAEKLETLKNGTDSSIVRQLIVALSKLSMEGEARILSRAETFQLAGTGDAANVQAHGVDAGAVVDAD